MEERLVRPRGLTKLNKDCVRTCRYSCIDKVNRKLRLLLHRYKFVKFIILSKNDIVIYLKILVPTFSLIPFPFLANFMNSFCCKGSSKFTPVTHVIFDLDGTIIDSEWVYAKALRQAVEDFGCEYPVDFITKVQGSTQQQVARTVLEYFNLDASPEEFLEKYNGYSDEYLGSLDLMPGAERMILHLVNNKIPIAVATSSSSDSYERKTKIYSDLFSNFHHIVCGGSDPEVLNGKPAPDIFLIAASRFDEKPDTSKCLVFEDSQNGLMAGLAAGMQVVMIPDHEIKYECWKLATLRLDSFNYMIPEAFGLPAFPQNEISPVFADMKISLIKLGTDENTT